VKRPCIIEGCAALTTGTYCTTHARRQARGYDRAHDRARRALVNALPLACHYCGELIHTSADLNAAHVQDGNPELGWCASHPRCNQKAKTR
jgi:hypothetical protein